MMKLKDEIQEKYHCKFDNMKLIRDMIGQVYYLKEIVKDMYLNCLEKIIRTKHYNLQI
jgi:hypothetical protein